jgi:ParB family chromosome partitioning protein
MQQTIAVSRIKQGKNPREYFDPHEMAELEAGIRQYGVLQAILVRPIPGTDDFEIIAGERRWRAAKNVFGDDYEIPVTIMEVDDGDAEAVALIENIHRADMSVAEEAKAAKRLLYRNRNDRQETAKQLGWSPAKLDGRLVLTACSEDVLKALTERRILVGHAELLSGVPPATQDSVLNGIVEHKVPVAVLKAQLGKFSRKLADAIFDTAECSQCPHNSAMQAGLFGESLGEGYCQHPTHFDELTTQAVEAKAAALKEEYQVIKIVKPQDGFEALPVLPEGDFGVGAEQYASCKGCQNFGCAVSNMPGSYGKVTPSLCYDATCHTKKVAARRKAERMETEANTPATLEKMTGATAKRTLPIEKEKPSN